MQNEFEQSAMPSEAELMAPQTPTSFNVRQSEVPMGTPRSFSETTSDVTATATRSATNTAASTQVIGSLSGYLHGEWAQAKQHRETSGVDAQIVRAKRARDQQYEPAKLAAIKNVFGQDYDPPYDPIIDVKCRALEAWLSDIILTPGDRSWTLEPTPIPDLPKEIQDTMGQMIEQRIAAMVYNEALAQGRVPTVDEVEERTKEVMPTMRVVFLAEMKRKAKEAVEKMTQKIDDQLTEGGWREAVKALLYDFVTYPACFLKGPTLKRDRRFTQKFNQTTRKYETVIEERKIDTWARVAPDKIYPEPHSSGINDGYLFELASYKRKDLYNAKDIEGYKEDAIRKVLNDHLSGGLHEWTLLDTEKRQIEKKSTFEFGSDIDCLIFWGTAPGRLLLEWGMQPGLIDDPDREYDIWAEMIGNDVIMARLNPDPLGQKPYYKTSLIEDPDRFWNKAMPDLLWDIASLCNAVLRSCGRNASFAASPMAEIAVDRLEDRNDTALYQERVFKSTSKAMLESPVVRFFQPQLHTGPLSQFLEACHTLADEWSGVPRITHGGDQSSSGVTSTASGTSMFITQSSRGVKSYAKNIDFGTIQPSVTKQYQTNLWENKNDEYSSPYLDAKVIARGSSSLIAKEQQSVRRNEFSATLSPEEKQILGLEGIKEVLREKIKSLEMDTDKLLPEDRDVIEKMTGLQIPGQAQPQLAGPESAMPDMGAETLAPSGEKSGGREYALFQGAQA
jgi:hypothetical protein